MVDHRFPNSWCFSSMHASCVHNKSRHKEAPQNVIYLFGSKRSFVDAWSEIVRPTGKAVE